MEIKRKNLKTSKIVCLLFHRLNFTILQKSIWMLLKRKKRTKTKQRTKGPTWNRNPTEKIIFFGQYVLIDFIFFFLTVYFSMLFSNIKEDEVHRYNKNWLSL